MRTKKENLSAASKKARCKNCLDSKDSVFSVLTPKEKEILADGHSCFEYKKNDIIYKEGDKPLGLLCLSEGKVKVYKDGIGGREQIVRMARPVNFIGYRALFADDAYQSSAMALEASVICMIERDTVFKLLRTNNELAINIMRYMARELGFSHTRTMTLTQKHIRGRLAESLLFLKDTYGFEEDMCTIKVYLSREDIASLSNMTTSNAIRTLSTLAAEKVISIEGRKIKILDVKKLERISEMG